MIVLKQRQLSQFYLILKEQKAKQLIRFYQHHVSNTGITWITGLCKLTLAFHGEPEIWAEIYTNF